MPKSMFRQPERAPDRTCRIIGCPHAGALQSSDSPSKDPVDNLDGPGSADCRAATELGANPPREVSRVEPARTAE
jgi:hypothetical protein